MYFIVVFLFGCFILLLLLTAYALIALLRDEFEE